MVDEKWNAQASQQACYPRQIRNLDAKEHSAVLLLKACIGAPHLPLRLLQGGLEPHFDAPLPLHGSERFLHLLERGKIGNWGKRFAHHLNVSDAIQAKEALTLSQVAVADGIP